MTTPSRAGSLVDALVLDAAAAIDGIAARLREQVAADLGRRGVVLGLSGGVDSSVCAALAVRAFGPSRVLGLVMPERESGADDAALAMAWARALGIDCLVEDIGPLLQGSGAYSRRDAAVRRLVPSYGDGWRCKISLAPDRLAHNRLSVFFLTVEAPDGSRQRMRLPSDVYREIVAATSFKQRARTMVEYYHADRMHYAVLGTPNRLEYDQGFFVKGGDGLADVKPIAHLYKVQVYQIARALGVPDRIIDRTPSTGTYSLDQGQDEFYFSVPLNVMDRALYAADQGLEPAVLAADLDVGVEEAERLVRDIARKRQATRYLHRPALLIEPIEVVG